MSHRHLSRSIVLQALFAMDVRHFNDDNCESVLNETIQDFGVGVDNQEFVTGLCMGVMHKKTLIDEIIVKAAPAWPLENISVVDRNILRIGLYELLFGDRDQVPPKVAINEAIELAKIFSGGSSSKFINGVLGTVYREIGEPGKEQVSKRKSVNDREYSEMPVEQKGAAVVYAYDTEQNIHLALVHDVFGYWTLAKGSIEEGESSEEGTVREVKEEINLDITIESKLGENEYIANHPENGKNRKQVTYYLAKSDFVPVVLEKENGGLDKAQWFPIADIADLTMYDDVTHIILLAIEKITKK